MSAMDKLLGRSTPQQNGEGGSPLSLMKILTDPNAMGQVQSIIMGIAQSFGAIKSQNDKIIENQDEIIRLLKGLTNDSNSRD